MFSYLEQKHAYIKIYPVHISASDLYLDVLWVFI